LYPITDFDLHLAALFENHHTTCYLKISVDCKPREQLREGTFKPVVIVVTRLTGCCGYRSDSGSSLSEMGKKPVALLMSTMLVL
jgi:hypothetical protein